METFDVIIVGGGPAGLSAAISAAKRGMRTCVIERGDYPGTKNVMGGVLYTWATDKVVPEFWLEAPLERPVIEQRYGILSGNEILSVAYRDPDWDHPPYNAHTVLRVKFDRWLAKQAESAGAMIITETVVHDLLYQGQEVVGVRTGRQEGDLGAKIVILAEGVNNFVAQKAGLAKPLNAENVAVVVKEIISLTPEKIEDRFCLETNQGATIELFGESTQGMLGTAFIYTNKDSISIGVGVLLHPLIHTKWTPHDLLEAFKAKLYVKRLLQGGETKEYLAHLIPEGGYNAMPRLYRQGVMVVGDTAMFVNAIHREGSNLAMTSGKIAGEVAAEAIHAGDVSEANLRHYEKRVRDSFIIKDLYKFRKTGNFFEENPHLLKLYPEIACNAMKVFFTANETPKKEVYKNMMKMTFKKRSRSELTKDIIHAWRAFQ
ncbi:MAG: FAD-dependent oxidoreductase [Peptococcaceae bacterium]|nr:FAD-dependent oxidoreductase [Peptococcaceae bacterium]